MSSSYIFQAFDRLGNDVAGVRNTAGGAIDMMDDLGIAVEDNAMIHHSLNTKGFYVGEAEGEYPLYTIVGV